MEAGNANEAQPNMMKWPSIELLIPALGYFAIKRPDKLAVLNKMCFETPYAASQKYDGTNVGKDETGLMYGRNLTIPSAT